MDFVSLKISGVFIVMWKIEKPNRFLSKIFSKQRSELFVIAQETIKNTILISFSITMWLIPMKRIKRLIQTFFSISPFTKMQNGYYTLWSFARNQQWHIITFYSLISLMILSLVWMVYFFPLLFGIFEPIWSIFSINFYEINDCWQSSFSFTRFDSIFL